MFSEKIRRSKAIGRTNRVVDNMIELHQLNKYYKVGKQKFHALKDIELTVGDGEMVAVVGKSGAGKPR